MSAPLRVALIGCGRIAQITHLHTLEHLESVQLVGLADPDLQRRTEAADRVPYATPYADYRRLLDEPDVHAVVVAVPTGLHAQVAIDAFEAGKHVFLEKPLAATVADGARIADAWRQAGTTGMIGYAFRHNPRYLEARALIEAGAIGAPVGGTSVFTSAPRELPAWKQQVATGGGVLLDLASHHADLAAYLFGAPIEAVSASTATRRTEGDQATVQFQMAGGPLVQSFFSLTAAQDHRFIVYGEEGHLTIDPWHRPHVDLVQTATRWTPAGRLRHMLRLAQRLVYRSDFQSGFRGILQAFAEASLRGVPDPSPSIPDGLHSLQVVEAAMQSATQDRTVAVEAMVPMVTT
ncbi:MAG: Gfo/Idh/MocA family oxidoreductase [Bacteroidota bacterium]